MTRIDSYCPSCESQVTEYLGQHSQPKSNTIYMCHVCDRSYCFTELLTQENVSDRDKKASLLEKLLGVDHGKGRRDD